MAVTLPVLGIDIGTSKSVTAWFNAKPGEPQIHILWEEDGNGFLIARAKRDLAADVVYPGPDRFTPIMVITNLLQKLKFNAEQNHFPDHVLHAVVACPATFTPLEKDNLQTAAQMAGFIHVDLVDEPVAAALAFTHSGRKITGSVLIFDLGASTFDAAVLEPELARDGGVGTFRMVTKPCRLPETGGNNFDRAIYEECDALLRAATGHSIGSTGHFDQKFLAECRQHKESLSRDEDNGTLFSASILTADGERIQFKQPLTRDTVEKLILHKVDETIGLSRSILDEAKSKGKPVTNILLAGGSSRMPLIERLLTDLANEFSATMLKWDKQEVAVALGAAIKARKLWGQPEIASKSEVVISAENLDAWLELIERSKAGSKIEMPALISKIGSSLAANKYRTALGAAAAMVVDAEGCDKHGFPSSAIHTAAGVLLHTHLNLPAPALAAFNKALSAIPTDMVQENFNVVQGGEVGATMPKYQTVEYNQQFSKTCKIFDISTSFQVASFQTILANQNVSIKPKDLSPQATMLEKWLHRAHVANVRDANSQLKMQLETQKAELIDHCKKNTCVLFVQQLLWGAVKVIHGSCSRQAVDSFRQNNCHPIYPSVWSNDPIFALHVADTQWESGYLNSTANWIKLFGDAIVNKAAASHPARWDDEQALLLNLLQAVGKTGVKRDQVASLEGIRDEALKALAKIPNGHKFLSDVFANEYKGGRYSRIAILLGTRKMTALPNANLYFWRASAHEKLGHYGKALEDGLQVTTLAPEYSSGFTELGWYYYKDGRYEEAIKASEQALKLNPQDAMAAFNAGLSHLACGHGEDAGRAYQAAIEIFRTLDKEAARDTIQAAIENLDELAIVWPEWAEAAQATVERLVLHLDTDKANAGGEAEVAP